VQFDVVRRRPEDVTAAVSLLTQLLAHIVNMYKNNNKNTMCHRGAYTLHTANNHKARGQGQMSPKANHF